MTNIEIKARCRDLARAEESLGALGAGPAATVRQRDTYFRVAAGRLKLRQLGPDEGQLIYYRRADVPGPRRSDYEITPSSDPETLRSILAQVLGVWVEVEKTRHVWLWENVRINLDEVGELGQFVELEAVTDEKDIPESRLRVETLMRALEIRAEDLLPGSYADLVAASG